MRLIVYPAGVYQANCYIAFDENSKAGIVVDPGGDHEEIIGICEKNKLNIKYIMLTHGHGDHIVAVNELKAHTGAKILMSKKDEYLVKGATQKMLASFRHIKTFEIDQYLEDEEIVDLEGFSIKVIETPGHTPGGLCFKINDILLSGDTLFRRAIGRTDFEFASEEEVINSIKKKLMTLPDDTKVYPGHGPASTIGYERINNYFLK